MHRDSSNPARTTVSGSPDERFVWWLWRARRFDAEAARRQGYDVVFPGWFSTAAGPDFREALIADADGTLHQGDVEVHVRTSGWHDHGHDANPDYDDVILHVVLVDEVRRMPVTHSGREVPTLALAPILPDPVEQLVAEFTRELPPLISCPGRVADRSSAKCAIEQSALLRMHGKIARMSAEIEVLGPDEGLYRGIAEALGYSQNREAFRQLAEALPFDLLRSLDLFQTEGLLLAAAGLAPGALLAPYLAEPVLPEGALHTFRVRPGNAPVTRLRGLARLVHRHRTGLAWRIEAAKPEDLHALFTVEVDETLVGRGRADDIVINVAVPFLAVTKELDPAALLAQLPAPADNRWTKALRADLRARGISFRPYRALHHQGLLDLALRHCRYGSCAACPLHEPALAAG